MALSPFRGFSDVQGEVDRLFNEMVRWPVQWKARERRCEDMVPPM
jgi:hypothetical protein